MTEDEEGARASGALGSSVGEDNSLGRLLTLSDGIFAIAMTLLSLDLHVPSLSGHVTEHRLLTALGSQSANYLSFVVSFYVVATYWGRHRRLMRYVVASHPAVLRDTLLLLLLVAAMPFFAGLLGEYGSQPIALALYGAANASASIVLILLSRDVQRLGLAAGAPTDDYTRRWQTWSTLAIFTLSIPAAFLLGRHGPWFLILLAVPTRFTWLRKLIPHQKSRPGH